MPNSPQTQPTAHATLTATRQVRSSANPCVHAFTVDVEDYFQVSAFEHRVSRQNWDRYESRVEQNTDRLLKLLSEARTPKADTPEVGVQATFFILGWVADRYPALVRRIAADGHSIASHGYWHELIYRQTPEQFADDLQRSVQAIGEACGVRATAYRAPSFSIVQRSIWALDILREHGFVTDSSIFPIRGHDRYGLPDARRDIHRIATQHGSLIEFPPSLGRMGRWQFPIGGGYFRLFPRQLTQAAIRQVAHEGRPAMFYIHPWEIDPAQPRLPNTGWKNRARHHVGLRSCERKLIRLLHSQSFASMETVLANNSLVAESEVASV